MRLTRLSQTCAAARSVPAPVVRTCGAWTRSPSRRVDRSRCLVAQDEAEAPLAARQRGAGREENTGGSRAPTRAQLEQYKVGQLVSGVVRGVTPYGAFLEVEGGVSGLLHISQISKERVEDVGAVLRVGDSARALVLRVDTEQGRISFSTQHLEPSPGDMLRDPQLVYDRAEETVAGAGAGMAAVLGTKNAKAKEPKIAERREPRANSRATPEALDRFQVGYVYSSVVQSVQSYGAFLELDGGVTGLLHVSQISKERVNDVGAVLRVGDSVRAMVFNIDADTGRITLSTKQLERSPGDMLRDPQLVYDMAEATAEQYRKRREQAYDRKHA